MATTFKHYLRVILDEPLDKHDIKGLIAIFKQSLPNIFSPTKEGTAVIYRSRKGKHVYDFNFARNVDEAEAEAILDMLNSWTDVDYEMEVTTTERYDLPDCEGDQDLDMVKHNRWIQKQVDDGWRYGLVFNETIKTDPKLRPYHDLTPKQKNS
jgi:hypothetical protein